MSRWNWPTLAAVIVASGAAAMMAGLARGAGVGRYVAAQAVVERRWAMLDGFVNGARPAAHEMLDGVTYVNGHYYLLEPPVLTWAAAPLYLVGALSSLLPVGLGWSPALVALLGPLLLLTALLGLARLGRDWGLAPGVTAAIVVAVALAFPMVSAAAAGVSWLLVAALSAWLLVGLAWRGRSASLGHGLLAGVLAASHPWLAPAALVAVLAPRAHLRWRVIGAAAPILLLGTWQLALFGRPWRFVGPLAPALAGSDPNPMVAAVVTLFVLGGGVLLARAAWRSAWAPALIAALVVVGVLVDGQGASAGRAVGLASAFGAGLVLITQGGLAAGTPARWVALGGAAAATAIVGLTTQRAPVAEVLLAFTPAQRLALAVVVGGVALVIVAGTRRVATTVALGLALVAPVALVAGLTRTVSAAAHEPLTPPFTAAARAGGPPLVLWRLSGGARLQADRLVLPDGQATAESPVVGARPGERYCAAAGPAVGQVLLSWEDDGKNVRAQQGAIGPQTRLCFAAPPGVTGVRLRLTGGATPVEVSRASLWAEEARLAPLPDYAVAALAFTFDWESAMGGLIHSKGGAGAYEGEGGGPAREESDEPVAIAVERGERMRQGALNLAALFRRHGIRGTFYSTGYNLLTGNDDRRAFAGDPIYRWANRANGWASNYWVTQRWYGDDPYLTEAAAPAWYFGSITRELAAAGHEIESHTFGHLYVRGTSLAEWSADLGEWNAAAVALGLRPARSFAFPWRSSNSVKAPHYEHLVAAGITSVTRVYRVRPGHEYELDEVADMPGLTIYPDQLLSSNAASALAARRAIDEVVLRRGHQSLWTHPEEVVDPDQVAIWRDVVDYAVAARDEGLWIAPVVEILDRVRAARSLEVVALREPGAVHVWVTNLGQTPVEGAVVETGMTGTATHAGVVWSDQRAQRVRAPALLPGEGLTWTIVAGSAPS